MKRTILNQQYEVLKILGSGGMSQVYLCRQINTNEKYAIKIMKQNIESINIENEWHILKCLNHKGIPKVKEIFIEENNFHLVEQFIEGITLQEAIENKDEFSTENIECVILQLCDIINYLHSFDPPIIYRDMKPSNIMLTVEGNVILLDFGISRLYKEDKTTDTIFMGSKGYAAPEQYGLSQSEKATDIYGIGAVLYFLVTGYAPRSIMEPLDEKNYSRSIPRYIIKIIQKAMQVDIKNRYSSVEELKKDILNCHNTISQEEYDYTKILSNEVTQVMSESFEGKKQYSRKWKRINTKRLGLLFAIPLITLLIIVATFAYFNKKTDPRTLSKDINNLPKPSSTPIATPQPTKKPDINTKLINKETVIEGLIKKSSPTQITKIENENNDKVKGKSENKKREEKDEQRILIYDLGTPSEVIKNENFKMKLYRLEFKEDYTIAYCSIENRTGKNLSLNYDNTAFYFDDDKRLPLIQSSSDLSLIKNNTRITNINIVFKSFELEEEKLILKTYINFNDKDYKNEINLIINVK